MLQLWVCTGGSRAHPSLCHPHRNRDPCCTQCLCDKTAVLRGTEGCRHRPSATAPAVTNDYFLVRVYSTWQPGWSSSRLQREPRLAAGAGWLSGHTATSIRTCTQTGLTDCTRHDLKCLTELEHPAIHHLKLKHTSLHVFPYPTRGQGVICRSPSLLRVTCQTANCRLRDKSHSSSSLEPPSPMQIARALPALPPHTAVWPRGLKEVSTMCGCPLTSSF